MRMMAVLLLAAVELGGAFGNAEVRVDEVSGNTAIVEIEVELAESAQAVIAHLSFEDDPVITLPLLDRGNGVFGIRTELSGQNYVVVFEALGVTQGTSDPVSFAELGAVYPGGEPGLRPPADNADDGLSTDSRRLLWLAIALGAGSLSALAFWVLGGRRRSAADEEE